LEVRGSTTIQFFDEAADSSALLHQTWLAQTVVQHGLASGQIRPFSGSPRLNTLSGAAVVPTDFQTDVPLQRKYTAVIAAIADGSSYLGAPFGKALVHVSSVPGHQMDIAILRNKDGIPTRFITFLDKKISSTVTATYRRIAGGWLLTQETMQVHDTTGALRLKSITEIDTVSTTVAIRVHAMLALASAFVTDRLTPRPLGAQQCARNPMTVCAPEYLAYVAAVASMTLATGPGALLAAGLAAIAALGTFHKCAWAVIQENKNCDVGDPHDETWLTNFTETEYAAIKSQCYTVAGSDPASIAACDNLDMAKWQIYQV
jgi:hypothetical protein